MSEGDRDLLELIKLLSDANPLWFDGQTGLAVTPDAVDLQYERIAAMADPPGDPPVTADEYRRAAMRFLGLPLDE